MSVVSFILSNQFDLSVDQQELPLFIAFMSTNKTKNREQFEGILESIAKKHQSPTESCIRGFNKLEEQLANLNEVRKNEDMPVATLTLLPNCETLEDLLREICCKCDELKLIAEDTLVAHKTKLCKRLTTKNQSDRPLPSSITSTSSSDVKSKAEPAKPKCPLYDSLQFNWSSVIRLVPIDTPPMPKGMHVNDEFYCIVRNYGNSIADCKDYPDDEHCTVAVTGYVEDSKARVFKILFCDPKYQGINTDGRSFITFAQVTGIDPMYGKELIKNEKLPGRREVFFDTAEWLTGVTKRVNS